MESTVEKTYAVGFDVYGTLVDPLALAEPLQALVGNMEIAAALPEEEPEYDESIADDVKMVICPECGHEFPL